MKFTYYRLVSLIILLTLLFQGSVPSLAANNTKEPAATLATTPQSAPAAFSCAGVTEIPQVECEALVALYNQTNGPNWINHTGWLETNTPCSWYGLTCLSEYVYSIYLFNNQLSGSIPSQLGNLINLKYLDLGANQISGSIPSQLGNLSDLNYLLLSNNQLSGSIPSQLSYLSNLIQLHLDGNQLSGSIPSQLGNITNLQDFELGHNQLTGIIPTQLGNLTYLQNINLYGNQLSGNIPTQLGSLTNLQTLYLGSNQLSGGIPSQLGNLPYLQYLELEENQLTGSIPSQLGNLANLRWLTLSGNQLSGSIPSQLGNLANLWWLSLSGNQLSSSIPVELGNLTNLTNLWIDYNQLNGSIPVELGNLTNLQYLVLGGNQLSGSIPSQLGNLVKLQTLDLGFNQLSGSIPSQLGNLANLKVLALSVNHLSGSIPSQMGNLAELGYLDLSYNQLSGSLPASFTNLTKLNVLYFDNTGLCIPDNAAFQTWLNGIQNLHSTGAHCAVGPELQASPSQAAADGSSSVSITLSNAPAGHRVRLVSSRGPLDQFNPATGLTDNYGQFTTALRSSTPGTTILTVEDLNNSQTLPVSASVSFTPMSGGAPPPAAQGPIAITGVNPRYALDGRYLQGIPVPNEVAVSVDWRGSQPGRVDFILNGVTYPEPAAFSGAHHMFNMGADLKDWQNSLRIIAYNQAGQASSPLDFAPVSAPAPVWLAGLQALGAIGPMVIGGSGQVNHEYTGGFKIPPNGLDLGAPGFGPSGSSTKLDFSFGGSIKLPMTCDSPTELHIQIGIEPKVDLVGVELGGELKGSGGLVAKSVNCQMQTPQGNVKVEVKIYGQKDWPVVVFVIDFIAPGAGDALQAVLPNEALKILGEVYLQGSLNGEFSSNATILDASPYLQWQGVTVGAGPGLEAGYQFDELGVKLHLYVGAKGMADFTSPHPLNSLSDLNFDHLTLTGEAGYTIQLFWWEQGDKYVVEWRYPPGKLLSSQAFDGEHPGWVFVPHPSSSDYAAFLAQPDSKQAFAPQSAPSNIPDLASSSTITSVLVSNVYTYTEPSLAIKPTDDHALLAWVHDDISKPVGQSQEIEYSMWNGSTWSTPAGVTNDHFLDAAPQVEWAGSGQAVAVWERLPQVQPITAIWNAATAQKIEIATSIYNPTSGVWSSPALLTQNTALDMIAQLARNPSGSLLAAWRQNQSGQLMGDSAHPDRIMTAFYNSGAWSTPAPAVPAVPGLLDLAVGYGNGEATIAYTRYLTPTDSITPTLQLFTTRWNGSTWEAPTQLTDDSLGHRAPQVVYNADNQPILVWLAGSELRLQNLSTGSSSSLTLPGEIGSIDQFRVVRSASGNIAAVFTAQAAQRDLYLAFYDNTHNLWGSPRRLTDNIAAENYPAPALDASGRLLVGYASTAVSSVQHTTVISGQSVTYTLPTDGPTDLVILAHTFDQNLTMQGLTVSNDHPMPGSSVIVTATFENTGDYPLDNVAVGFYDGNPASGGVLFAKPSLSGSLSAGSTATLPASYLVPNSGVHAVFAVVDPDHKISETNENDNTANLPAFGPDLEIDSANVDYWGGSDVGLQAIVRNIGSSPTPVTNLEFYSQSITGTLLASQPIPALDAGVSITLTVPWNFGSLPAGSSTLAALARYDDFTDILPTNNSTTFTLDVLPDLMVSPYYLWTTPLTDTNVTITTTIYNLGPVDALNVSLGYYKRWTLDDAGLIITRTLPLLPAASATTIIQTVSGPLGCGLYVQANASQTIQESSYANNLASIVATGGTCANFWNYPTSGTVPLTVIFTDTSTDATSWLWDFGDGGSSALPNPTHSYTTRGTYTVTLTINGSDQFVRPSAVRVYNPAHAAFQAEPVSGLSPLQVNFSDQSSGDISTWSWDFGDGSISAEQNPSHTFTTPGGYTVILTVSGSGGTDTKTKAKYITVYAHTHADFIATPSSGKAPLKVEFTNKSTGDFTSSLWDFGDQSTSTLASPQHTYDTPGVYTVTLTVHGLGGNDQLIKTGYIAVQENEYHIYLPRVMRILNNTSYFLPAQPPITERLFAWLSSWFSG